MHDDLDPLADEIDLLLESTPSGAWFGDVELVALRARQQMRDSTPAREEHADVIDLAPRFDPRLRRLDRRLERIDQLAATLHLMSTGNLRSAEATRVTLFQLSIELKSLAHQHRKIVVDAVSVDIGGRG